MSDKIAQLAGGKPVAIFGTGASGTAAKKLLDSLGIASVFYAETSAKKPASGDASAVREFSADAAKRHALAVYSPAFRPDHKWIETARNAGATTICEPDLSALAWSGSTIAITGTNGKTTLTSFITHALNIAGCDAFSAGNIGAPLSAFCPEYGRDPQKTAVCELSSFQTSNLQFLRPDFLLWTNFAPDHLDWHKDMEEYFRAKFNLVSATKGGIVVGSSVADAAREYGAKLPDAAVVIDESATRSAPPPFDSSIQARNFAMAVEFGKLFGLDKNAFEKAAKTFNLPAFRFSKPIEVGGVRFYNDSKATNIHAALAALEELKGEKNLVWLGGGKDKLCDLKPLTDAVNKRAKAAVLIGQTARKLADGLEIPAFVCESMAEAVKRSYELADGYAAVLFSPAFSSFGMFSGYVERGKSFENEVLCLKNLNKM